MLYRIYLHNDKKKGKEKEKEKEGIVAPSPAAGTKRTAVGHRLVFPRLWRMKAGK